MTQVGEGIAVAVGNQTNTVDCVWKDCKKNHTKSVNYPKGGKVTRNGTYEANWVSAGLEPWVLKGPGKNSKSSLAEYRTETPAAAYAVTAAALSYPEYHTQKHHLLSVNFFDGVKKLAHNAELVGYDVNHKNNGICLPSYVIDIVQHDLQCHRGSHPKALYNDKVKALLTNLELRCIKYCEMENEGGVDNQKQLINDLNTLSERVASKITTWKWLLRSNALAERVSSQARYQSLQQE